MKLIVNRKTTDCSWVGANTKTSYFVIFDAVSDALEEPQGSIQLLVTEAEFNSLSINQEVNIKT